MWLSILKQLQDYHIASSANTNCFSTAAVGTRIAFFIYIHDIHSNFPNKGKDYNGFLSLIAMNEGVKLNKQFDSYEPQIVWYDLAAVDTTYPREDKHSIHMIFSYLRMHYGAPHITYVDSNSTLSHASVSKLLEKPQPIYRGKSDILEMLDHQGKLSVFKSNQ